MSKTRLPASAASAPPDPVCGVAHPAQPNVLCTYAPGHQRFTFGGEVFDHGDIITKTGGIWWKTPAASVIEDLAVNGIVPDVTAYIVQRRGALLALGCIVDGCTHTIGVDTHTKNYASTDPSDTRLYFDGLHDIHLIDVHRISPQTGSLLLDDWQTQLETMLALESAEESCRDVRTSIELCLDEISSSLTTLERALSTLEDGDTYWWQIDTCTVDDLRAEYDLLHRRLRAIGRIVPEITPEWKRNQR